MENSWIFPVVIAAAIFSIIGFVMACYAISLAMDLKDEYDYMRRINDVITEHAKSVIKLANEIEEMISDEP